jgi:trehalose/maltose transport system substrate-binding protein
VTEKRLAFVRWAAIVICAAMLAGCHAGPEAQQSRSITVLVGLPKASLDSDTREFTNKTGITIRFIPGSESASRRLEQELSILHQQSPAVDVFQIDTIWPGMMASYLVDLRQPLAGEFAQESRPLIENATVGGRVVGAPYLIEYGLLYYRTDLLRKYGFEAPPRTWDELELQAVDIQKGERAHGRTDFWGYVWQGADYEGLTCNALEWQYSQEGGNFIEPDRTIDVQNPAAIDAFVRATRWIGTISPPGGTSYLEEDSRNIWQSGRAAFMRNWSGVYTSVHQSKEVGNRFAIAPLPAGGDPHSSALGGWYLGVSKYSRHGSDAIAFVKYLSGKGLQRQRAMEGALPTYPSLYQDPAVLRANTQFALLADVANRLIRRPSVLAGPKYDRVSRAYAHGIHSILTHELSAAEGAATIQAELKRITGLPDSARVASGSAARERR